MIMLSSFPEGRNDVEDGERLGRSVHARTERKFMKFC